MDITSLLGIIGIVLFCGGFKAYMDVTTEWIIPTKQLEALRDLRDVYRSTQ